jgi:hypothetical protein
MSPAVSESPTRPLWKADRTCEELGGISPKTLFNITRPRGDLPCVRLGPTGRILRYDPEVVRSYIKSRSLATAADSGVGPAACAAESNYCHATAIKAGPTGSHATGQRHQHAA